MQQEPLSTEQRLAILESKIAEWEQERARQEDRDIALLARIDGFIDDLRRIERVQMRAFDALQASSQEHSAQLKAQSERLDGVEQKLDRIEQNISTLAEAAKDHKQAIETLATGQQQVINLLSLLTGHTKTND